LLGTFSKIVAPGLRLGLIYAPPERLWRSYTVEHLLVSVSALRDEGFSYHYLPPSREVAASPEGIEAIRRVLEKHQCAYLLSKTWTTDAIFRETPDKVKLRKSEGCYVWRWRQQQFLR